MLTSMPAAMRSPEYSGIYYAREGEADQELGIRSKERCTSDNNGFFILQECRVCGLFSVFGAFTRAVILRHANAEIDSYMR